MPWITSKNQFYTTKIKFMTYVIILAGIGSLCAVGVVIWAFLYNYHRAKMIRRVAELKFNLSKNFPNFDEIISLLTKFNSNSSLQLFLDIYNEGLPKGKCNVENLEQNIKDKFSSTEWNRILYLWDEKGILKSTK